MFALNSAHFSFTFAQICFKLFFSTRLFPLRDWVKEKCILLFNSIQWQPGWGWSFIFCISFDSNCVYWLLIYLINSFSESIFIEYVFFQTDNQKKGSLDQINGLENSGFFCIALGLSRFLSLVQFNYHSQCWLVFVQIYLHCETFPCSIFLRCISAFFGGWYEVELMVMFTQIFHSFDYTKL